MCFPPAVLQGAFLLEIRCGETINSLIELICKKNLKLKNV